MENVLIDILDTLRHKGALDSESLERLLRAHNKGHSGQRRYAKKALLPYYLHVKEHDPERWRSWNVDADMEKLLVQTLKMKPRRTASGVATLTVLTKPWPCANSCLYCPNDVRMPKSYLADEPACQRAERAFFDPYLQAATRLRALRHMGHVTDKVELIVLGGTWTDYPPAYRAWFVAELFRALNEAGDAQRTSQSEQARRALYCEAGIESDPTRLATLTANAQHTIDAGTCTYNEAVRALYGESKSWRTVSAMQTASLNDVKIQHIANEEAHCRCVGLVMETRPDAVTCKSLTELRQLGCTKVQVGIQSLDAAVLAANNRATDLNDIKRAFALLRLFGFKIHAHAMVNLLGSTCQADKRDYRRLVTEADWLPDEVKLYPCALVGSSDLCTRYTNGAWQPYTEQDLVDVLAADVLVTPPYVRVSRMIRDISATDILAGNKKGNLRQLVEEVAEQQGTPIAEIRHREIGLDDVDPATLTLAEVPYRTTVSNEMFLQWVAPDGRIAGFLRLSLPDAEQVRARGAAVPINPGEAMIREVHVYGRAASISGQGQNAQHLGLGRKLVERACELARERGYRKINVISAIGTRAYYRSLGFTDNGFYQQRTIAPL